MNDDKPDVASSAALASFNKDRAGVDAVNDKLKEAVTVKPKPEKPE